METMFTNYIDLVQKIDELEVQREELRAQIQDAMQKAETPSIKHEYGNFFLTTRRTWTYSEALKKFQDAVKEEQARQQATSEATFEEQTLLSFKAAK
jgi:hypothetical protein